MGNKSIEKAFHNIKVRQNMSNQSKTDHSAMNFAIIKSVIDTSI
jgi:hypothetical protein